MNINYIEFKFARQTLGVRTSVRIKTDANINYHQEYLSTGLINDQEELTKAFGPMLKAAFEELSKSTSIT